MFRSNPLSLLGPRRSIAAGRAVGAVFADFITPFPDHVGAVVDFANCQQAAGVAVHHSAPTLVGRDLLTRIVFAYRISLILGVVVLAIAVPIGVIDRAGRRLSRRLDRICAHALTDIFLSIPPLVLAMSMMGVLRADADQRHDRGHRHVVALVHAAGLQPHALGEARRATCSPPR